MCSGCFPQAEQPAWPQLSKPQALGEDEAEAEGRRRKEAQRGPAGRVAGLAKVRRAEAAWSVGTVREGMCEMLWDEVSSYSQTA